MARLGGPIPNLLIIGRTPPYIVILPPAEGTDRSSAFEENRRRHDDRILSLINSSPRGAAVFRESLSKGSLRQRTQLPLENTPQDSDHPRETYRSPVIEASSRSKHSPAPIPHSGSKRNSAISRLSDPRSGNQAGSEEIVSTMERLSVNMRRTSQAGASASASEHLQSLHPIDNIAEDLTQPLALYSSPHPPC